MSVGSLEDIDALVGDRVMHEFPTIHWEDTYAHFRFDSVDEAIEAFRDPAVCEFIPPHERSSTSLEEVREYPPYSSELLSAWKVIEHLREYPLQLRQERDRWIASFGDDPEREAESASLAICLAALRTEGIEVAFGAVEKKGTRLLNSTH